MAIQRYSHGKWHTVHTGTTKAKTGAYAWAHRYVKKAKYRAGDAGGVRQHVEIRQAVTPARGRAPRARSR